MNFPMICVGKMIMEHRRADGDLCKIFRLPVDERIVRHCGAAFDIYISQFFHDCYLQFNIKFSYQCAFLQDDVFCQEETFRAYPVDLTALERQPSYVVISGIIAIKCI